MSEKFNHLNPDHFNAMKCLPFSYFSLEEYLDENASVFERNGETIIGVKNQEDPTELQALFPPIHPLNRQNISIRLAQQSDRDQMAQQARILFEKQTITEFFYRTHDFVHPTGRLAKKIRVFSSRYKPTVTHTYPKDAILEFYRQWEDQRVRDVRTIGESEASFFLMVDRLDHSEIKQVYVEIDGALAGFAWGIPHWSGNWVGLHMTVSYQYQDLNRFLHHERAKLFSGSDIFSTGTSMFDTGVDLYKHNLGPVEERRYFFLLLGEGY